MHKILVIDDDENILLLLKIFLSNNGYNPRVSNSCAEGLSFFYHTNPDLVLMDINVGSEDGRDVCRTIKNQAEYRHIPVVLMSSNREALRTHHEYGAEGAIEKPFELSHLLQTLKDCLSQK